MPKRHAYQFLMEPLMNLPGYLQRPMFGCVGCYYNGRIVAVLADREPPWRAFIVPAEKDQHAAIMAEFPQLAPHPVLPKWLTLPEEHDAFETVAAQIVDYIKAEDPRFGCIPKPKKKRAKKG